VSRAIARLGAGLEADEELAELAATKRQSPKGRKRG
jgi:hypothetical protein